MPSRAEALGVPEFICNVEIVPAASRLNYGMSRKRAWKGAISVFGGMLLILGILTGDAQRRATAIIERHSHEVIAKIASIRERSSRPPIMDDPLPGDAWSLYKSIISSMGTMSGEDQMSLGQDSVDPGAGWQSKEHQRIVAKYASEIDALRTTLRMQAILPAYRYSPGPGCIGYYDDNQEYSAILELETFAARLFEMGRRREALESILACLAMNQDVLAGGRELYPVCIDVEERMASRMQWLFQAHDFTAGDLEFFARMLDRLEARRPTLADFMSVQDVLERSYILEVAAGGAGSLRRGVLSSNLEVLILRSDRSSPGSKRVRRLL